MDPVQAAATGGPEILVFALSVASGIVAIEGMIIFWLIKTRMAERYQRDRMIDKSFDAGRDQFSELREKVADRDKRHLTTNDFREYCKAHEKDHEKITENMGYISEQIHVLDGKMDASAKLLSRLVVLGKPEGD